MEADRSLVIFSVAMHTREVSNWKRRLGLNVMLTFFLDLALTIPLWLSNLKQLLRMRCTLLESPESSLCVYIILSSMYKLQLALLVIVTLSVFVYPTVIVPKSRSAGLITIMPSAPAPTISMNFDEDCACCIVEI